MSYSKRYLTSKYSRDEKEKIQSKFTADSKLKPSTLHRKQLLILKTDHLQAETEHVQVDHLRASKILSKNAISREALVQKVTELQK